MSVSTTRTESSLTLLTRELSTKSSVKLLTQIFSVRETTSTTSANSTRLDQVPYITTITNSDGEPKFGCLTKKRKRKWTHMIETVWEKFIRINLMRDPPSQTPQQIARMNAPPPIDEVMFSENENDKDDFSEVGGSAEEQSDSFIESYL